MNEQEQLSAQATQTGEAAVPAADPATQTPEPVLAVTGITAPPDPAPDLAPVSVSVDVMPGSMHPDANPAPEDTAYPAPVPSGAINALLDEMHNSVEWARDEVRDTVRALVERLRGMF